MPGIVTHNKIFSESVRYLSTRKKRSYLLRSIESLFSTKEFYSAGLYGALGPNMFDYFPERNREAYYGHELSFSLHNGGSGKLLAEMVKRIQSYPDKNNEWVAAQRAYLYGFISHIISDTVFHPYVFYWSGFPDNFNWNEIIYFREQNLLFQYNIDNYYEFYGPDAGKFKFSIDDMLPLEKNAGLRRLYPAVKAFILETMEKSSPEAYRKLLWPGKKSKRKDTVFTVHLLDVIPQLIRACYKIKRNRNRRLMNFFSDIRRKKIFYSDFIVRYPSKQKLNMHVLNFHRERWEYPAGKKGFNYESIDTLLAQSCDRIVSVWEKIESGLFGKTDIKVFEEFGMNAFTGRENEGYYDMRIKNPVRLHY